MKLFGLDISKARSKETPADLQALSMRIQRLEMAFNQFVEHFTALQGAHAKLRNQFHGAKGGRPAHAEPSGNVSSIPFGDKRALRAALMPGGRAIHTPEESDE